MTERTGEGPAAIAARRRAADSGTSPGTGLGQIMRTPHKFHRTRSKPFLIHFPTNRAHMAGSRIDARADPAPAAPRPGRADTRCARARRVAVLPHGGLARPVRSRHARPPVGSHRRDASASTRTPALRSMPSPGSPAPSAALAIGTARHDRAPGRRPRQHAPAQSIQHGRVSVRRRQRRPARRAGGRRHPGPFPPSPPVSGSMRQTAPGNTSPPASGRGSCGRLNASTAWFAPSA
jgi:hypothetical protein